MYAVIFRAELNSIDEQYHQMAAQLRTLALSRYGCVEFTSVNEGDNEIAISYWNSEQDIQAWRQDETHQAAQKLGREKWYCNYRVDVVEVKRQYHSS